ncbi:MAG: Uma2 family endonuclease [Akkermansiaceae bacterium]|nr:Uma2 family endonuclease [Armatimonadota bacterium]
MTLTITLEDEIAKEGEVRIHAPNLSDAGFYEFCRRNPLLPIERTKEMDILVMTPADSFGDSRNFELCLYLGNWNNALPTPGIAFGPSAGFTFPNGAIRSPDAAWISADHWNALPVPLRAPFAHIAPDFVVEIMSPSDRLPKAQEKMHEYITSGVRLGWLVDRANRTVYVYRPNLAVATLLDATLLDPMTVSGDPELPGLVVDMTRVFQDSL